MISSTSSAKFACLLNFSYRHTCKYAVLNYRFHEHRGMQLRLEYLSTNVHARENLFCFRQELSDRFTSACMHAREQTYGKSTSTLVALGAVPSSALSVSRLLLTGGVPGKYRKQRLQTLGFTEETSLSVFTQLQHAHYIEPTLDLALLISRDFAA